MSEKHNRRWFAFRLWTLLIVVAVLSIPLAWVAHNASLVRERRTMLKYLATVDPFVLFTTRSPARLGWIRMMLGDTELMRIELPTHKEGERGQIQRLFPETEVVVRP